MNFSLIKASKQYRSILKACSLDQFNLASKSNLVKSTNFIFEPLCDKSNNYGFAASTNSDQSGYLLSQNKLFSVGWKKAKALSYP